MTVFAVGFTKRLIMFSWVLLSEVLFFANGGNDDLKTVVCDETGPTGAPSAGFNPDCDEVFVPVILAKILFSENVNPYADNFSQPPSSTTCLEATFCSPETPTTVTVAEIGAFEYP